MIKLNDVDVTIIGAGIIGAACARELSRYDLRIRLVEKEVDVGFGTSKANSGIVHSGIHEVPGTLKSRLCVAGNKLYPQIASELDVLYRQNGTVVAAKESPDLIQLENLRRNGLANGVNEVALLNGEDLRRLEPNLSPALAGGLIVPTGGIVVPFDFVYALVENSASNGVDLRTGTEVVAVARQGGKFIITTPLGTFQSDYLVNAAGLISAHIARMIGDDSFQVFSRKGEEYLLDRRLAGLVRRTVFPLPTKTSKGILVIPTVDGNIMLGPTARRVDSFSDLETTANGWMEIFQSASELLLPSIIKLSDLITSFAGIRAVGDRQDFHLAPSPVAPRMIHAAGIQSPGLTAAPAIAQYLAELLKEAGLILKPKPHFNPERRLIRLRDLPRESQARLMKENPAFANIICRCELVSEAEIRAAVRRGATTLDGVKLRTRAGMGRCQGGFCTPKIIRILGEELDLPPEKITKNGPGSEMLSGTLRSIEGGS